MVRVICFAIISLFAISIGCSSGGWGNNQQAYPIGPYPQTGYPPQNYQNAGYPTASYPVANQQLPNYTGVPAPQLGQQPGYAQPVYAQPINGALPNGGLNYGQPITGSIPQGASYSNGGYPGGYYQQNQGVPFNSMSPSQPLFGR